MNTHEHIIWKGIAENIEEHCFIENHEGQRTINGKIRGNIAGEELVLSYKIRLDAKWFVKDFKVENESDKKPFKFEASQYSTGRWKNQKGEMLNVFNDCIDIDIFPTPFTNTLPLKRQPLHIGEEREFLMLWIDMIEGKIKTARQRYRRLNNTTYRLTSLDTNFTADIVFTEHAMVRYYPGLFELSSYT